MPPKRFAPDDPREWLNRARSNLARAQTVIPEVYLEDLCFDAQQAAEKAIKSVLIHRGVTFPYIHDLAQLLTILEQEGGRISASVRQAERLTRFAVEARYPGVSSPPTKKEYERVIRIAKAVVQWASEQVGDMA